MRISCMDLYKYIKILDRKVFDKLIPIKVVLFDKEAIAAYQCQSNNEDRWNTPNKERYKIKIFFKILTPDDPLYIAARLVYYRLQDYFPKRKLRTIEEIKKIDDSRIPEILNYAERLGPFKKEYLQPCKEDTLEEAAYKKAARKELALKEDAVIFDGIIRSLDLRCLNPTDKINAVLACFNLALKQKCPIPI